VTTKASDEPSFVRSLAKQGAIKHAVVGVHIEEDRGELTLGGYNCEFVEGGCENINWLPSTNLTDWQIQTT